MEGITMPELYEWLVHCHEAEFTYHGTTYVLQPEADLNDKEKTYLVIWELIPGKEKCISKFPIPQEGNIPKERIDAIMNDKCFGGKSFMEIEKDVRVDVIY